MLRQAIIFSMASPLLLSTASALSRCECGQNLVQFSIGREVAPKLLPAVRDKPRARLHKFLRVIHEMLGIFCHHLKSPSAPFLISSHCVRDRTGCCELRDKFGCQTGLRLYALKPLPVSLPKIAELLSLGLGKLPETLQSSSWGKIELQFFRPFAVNLRHDTPP